MMTDKKAISYLRFSTKKQGRKDRDSTRRQMSMATQWCQDNAVTLDDSIKYHDLGVSAYRGKNAAMGMLKAILDEVAKPGGRIRPGNYLLVEAIDRLSRAKPLDSFDLVHRLVKAGLTIVTLADGQRYSKDTLNNEPGKIYILMGAIQAAHQQSDDLRRRVEDVHKRKRKEMEAGLKTRHACPFWLNWDELKRHYIPNDHAAMVKEIFRMRTKPGVGKATITAAIKDKYVMPTGQKLEGVVSYVLSCGEVVGDRTLYRWDGDAGKLIKDGVIKEYYPAVVKRKTFELARRNMEMEKFHVRGSSDGVSNLFTGLLRCFKCGGRVSVSSQTHRTRGIKIRYAICQRKRLVKDCNSPSVRLEYLEQVVLQCLTKELVVSDVIADERISDDLARTLAEADALMTRIAYLTAQAEALTDNMCDVDLGAAAKKRLIQRLNSSESQIEGLQRDHAKIMARASSLQSFASGAESSLAVAKALVLDANEAERPDGPSLQSQWAEIVASKHPAQTLKATDRAKLRSAIATLVETIIIQPDRSAEILFKSGVRKSVQMRKYADVGWAQVARIGK